MDRSSQIVKVSIVGIAVNLILVAFKAFVGAVTGSIAVVLDALNNLSDALSSVITIVGAKLANRPPDKKHPYGYGRIEHITSIIIAVLVLAAGFTSFRESFEKILHPEAASYNAVSLVIIAAAVVAKLFLGRYVKARGKALNSDSLVASGTDASFDAVLSLSTLVAAAVSLIFHISIEGWLGAIIAIVILKAGVEILLDSLGDIIGARVESDLSTKLKERIVSYPDVLGAYDLTLHRYGPERVIGSVHVELPDGMTAREIHMLTRRITEDVYANFGIILTMGVYASNTADGIFAQMKDRLKAIIAKHPEILQMHGFYVDTDRMLVTFDIIVDFACERKAEIRDSVISEISAAYPDYTFSAILDSDFSD